MFPYISLNRMKQGTSASKRVLNTPTVELTTNYHFSVIFLDKTMKKIILVLRCMKTRP